MKIPKGQAGYIPARKKKLLLYTALEFGAVALFLITGYLKTHTRLNLFTLFAVLLALPASKMLVELIAIAPYKTIDPAIAEEIEDKAELLTRAYDLIITSTERAMQVDAVVISNRTVFGYTGNSRTDTAEVSGHIRGMLEENHIKGTTVKVFHEYNHFLSRAEGLNNIIGVNHSADRELESSIRNILLHISM